MKVVFTKILFSFLALGLLFTQSFTTVVLAQKKEIQKGVKIKVILPNGKWVTASIFENIPLKIEDIESGETYVISAVVNQPKGAGKPDVIIRIGYKGSSEAAENELGKETLSFASAKKTIPNSSIEVTLIAFVDEIMNKTSGAETNLAPGGCCVTCEGTRACGCAVSMSCGSCCSDSCCH